MVVDRLILRWPLWAFACSRRQVQAREIKGLSQAEGFTGPCRRFASAEFISGAGTQPVVGRPQGEVRQLARGPVSCGSRVSSMPSAGCMGPSCPGPSLR